MEARHLVTGLYAGALALSRSEVVGIERKGAKAQRRREKELNSHRLVGFEVPTKWCSLNWLHLHW
jgi:hypothetical protein